MGKSWKVRDISEFLFTNKAISFDCFNFLIRYGKSRCDKQLLRGNSTSLSDTDSCKPIQLLESLPIVPCGLVAWSLFNDTYKFTIGGQLVAVNKKGIAWKRDREHKFGNVYPQNFLNNLPSNENGTLIGGASLDPTIPVSK